MIRAIIVDDEESGRKTLHWLLSEYCPNVRIEGMASNIKDAQLLIRKSSIDLIFLDINLSNESGFQLIDFIKNANIAVVFVTAYNEYAIKAFRYSALHYLMKPVDCNELIEAVSRAQVDLEKKSVQEKLRVLSENIISFKNDARALEKLVLPSLNGYEVLSTKSIVRCEGDGPYTTIHINSGSSYIVSKPLKEINMLLTGFNFFRIHRTHLINLDYVIRYHKGRGGDVELFNGELISVSRNMKQDLLDALRRNIGK